jgi:hypothetical protein
MKKYLLTWYGITDLNAALGFEEHGGPILGALRNGQYTDVLILAYTDPSKESGKASRQALLKTLPSDLAKVKAMPRVQAMIVTDAFANTSDGHRFYKEWLKRQIKGLDEPVNIQICARELDHLNDAKGIYAAATDALDIVYSDRGEKQVTCYLSPGTPVMAFTWALVSMVNPELNIRVIACPDFRKPPEQIQLPYELLAPSARKGRQPVRADRTEFDVIYHLFGEQRLPSVFGISQFPCKQHVFVTSDKYPAATMRHFLPSKAKFQELLVNPFDPMSAKVAVLKSVAEVPEGSRIGFNLTGGTKLMFAGAIAACRKVGGTPFYFETRDRNLVFLDDFSVVDMRGIDNVDLFFQINGFAVSRKGLWNDVPIRKQRVDLTNILWQERQKISRIYRQLEEYTDFEGDRFMEFHVSERDVVASLDRTGQANLKIGKAVFDFKRCPDFAKYLCGGWLEEYTYLLLEPLLKQGLIRDLRIGLEVAWQGSGKGNERLIAQEFDVVFTEGKRLFIIECKAGNVFSEHFYKLQNCVRNYGGVEARGILAAAFPFREAVRKRFEAASNLTWLSGEDVPRQLRNMATFE